MCVCVSFPEVETQLCSGPFAAQGCCLPARPVGSGLILPSVVLGVSRALHCCLFSSSHSPPLLAYLDDSTSVSHLTPQQVLGWLCWAGGCRERRKASKLHFLLCSLFCMASFPATQLVTLGNGILTSPFQIDHIIIKSSLLILALPLVGSPGERGTKCTVKTQDCFSISLGRLISSLHA